MGIKFLCPNGHKLNVKGFLAGKRAICPKCGARVVVPSGEQPTTSGHEDDAEAPEYQIATAAAEDVGTPPLSHPPTVVDAPATSATVDPLAEAPTAVWYVRPATGGQFGPASGEIMRAWLNDGRIGASSLVWRAGWNEWRAAAAIFPQLAGLLASPGIAVAPPQIVSAADLSAPPRNGPPPLGPSQASGPIVQSVPVIVAGGSPTLDPAATLTQGMRRRRRRNQANMLASGGLVLLIVALLVVLFVVWRRQAPTEEVPADASAAAASVEP